MNIHRHGRLDRFFFAPVDPAAVAVFRVLLAIAVGGMFLRGISLRFPGWLPLPPEAAVFCSERIYRGACGIVLLAFAAGWRSRMTGRILLVLLFPLLFSQILEVGRMVLWNLLLVFSLFRPVGLLCFPAASAGPMWIVQLLRLQLTLLYGVNALAKATPAYLSGDILRGMSRMLPHFLQDLAQDRLVLGPVHLPVTLAAWISVAAEAFLALAFWSPRLRPWAAATGIGFHLLIKGIIRIGFLDVVTIFCYLPFFLPFERRGSAPATGGSGSGSAR